MYHDWTRCCIKLLHGRSCMHTGDNGASLKKSCSNVELAQWRNGGMCMHGYLCNKRMAHKKVQPMLEFDTRVSVCVGQIYVRGEALTEHIWTPSLSLKHVQEFSHLFPGYFGARSPALLKVWPCCVFRACSSGFCPNIKINIIQPVASRAKND